MRVIILAGAGKHFSAGHDLGSPQEMEDQKKTPLEPGFKGEYRRLWERFFENTMRWRDLPKPTIAQVQGYCIMGGMMIASACDIIIASEDAQFADRAVKWGGSHVQYFSMPWDFGPRKTKEYLFTGDFISAADAEKAGLVNRVVSREKLEEETMALAQRIAERDPYALKLAKASVNETHGRAGLAAGDGERLQELHAHHPAPHRDGNLRRRRPREVAEGSLRRSQQEGGLIVQRFGVTTGRRAGAASPSGTLKVSVVTRRMPS